MMGTRHAGALDEGHKACRVHLDEGHKACMVHLIEGHKACRVHLIKTQMQGLISLLFSSCLFITTPASATLAVLFVENSYCPSMQASTELQSLQTDLKECLYDCDLVHSCLPGCTAR